MNYIIAKGLLIPFLGTALGSALVFFMKKELDSRIQKILSGFAAGVMVAASVNGFSFRKRFLPMTVRGSLTTAGATDLL